jgi:hypothetical protein
LAILISGILKIHEAKEGLWRTDEQTFCTPDKINVDDDGFFDQDI